MGLNAKDLEFVNKVKLIAQEYVDSATHDTESEILALFDVYGELTDYNQGDHSEDIGDDFREAGLLDFDDRLIMVAMLEMLIPRLETEKNILLGQLGAQ